MLYKLSTLIGEEYLGNVLDPFIEYIVANDIIVEISPDKVDEIPNDDLDDNIELTIELLDILFPAIKESVSKVPR